MRRLEHNCCHYTQSWCQQFRKIHSSESIFISLGLPRQCSQIRLSRGFLVLSASRFSDSIRKERIGASGLLSCSSWQSVFPIEFGVFRSCPSLSLSSILFATTVRRPARAPTMEMPGHLAPAFHLFEPCPFFGVEPARRLVSRQQSSTRLLRKVQTNRANHLFAMKFADRSMGADNTSNGQ